MESVRAPAWPMETVAVGAAPVKEADVGAAGTQPVAPLAAGIAEVGAGAWAGPFPGAGCRTFSEGAGGWVPVMTCCDGCDGPGPWTGNGRDSGGGGGVIGIGGSDPGVWFQRYVHRRGSPVLRPWLGRCGGQSPGGGSDASAGDGECSQHTKYILGCPNEGLGIGGAPLSCRRR